MTKARDLANIISGGFTESDIPNLSASKITSGSLADARIPNLATSKITSGTFADARLSQSSVQQYASTFDDNKIVNDISTLAIRQASNENKGAYNTNSMYVDVFQDSTGVTGLTNVERNSSEYISSVIPAYGQNSNTKILCHMNDANLTSAVQVTTAKSGDIQRSSAQSKFGGYSALSDGNGDILTFSNMPSLGSSLWGLDFWWYPTGGLTGSGRQCFFAGTDDSEWFGFGYDQGNQKLLLEVANSSGAWQSLGSPTGTKNNFATGQWYHIAIARTSDTNVSWYVDGVLDKSVTVASGTIRCQSNPRLGEWGGNQSWYYYGYIDEYRFQVGENPLATSGDPLYISGSTFTPPTKAYAGESINATGSFTSNNITAPSSTNKMGAIITYQDNAGTNTLNTDIVLKLSADGGSNYATATMTAMPDFASGIKMAKVNDLSVTAGTSLKYKIEFANQSSGSKEARIRGVSLQY